MVGMDALRERMESGCTLSWLAKNDEGPCDFEAGDICPVKRSEGGACPSASQLWVGRVNIKPHLWCVGVCSVSAPPPLNPISPKPRNASQEVTENHQRSQAFLAGTLRLRPKAECDWLELRRLC